jgi:small subunit ribosomal protein S1
MKSTNRHIIGNLNIENSVANFSTGENFSDLFEESVINEKKEGTVITGDIIGIEGDMIVIDLGLKSEGRIPIKEFAVLGKVPDLKVGDQVEVYLDRIESRNGKALVSREKALREESWNVLEKSLQDSAKVDGVILGKVKGGFTVDIGGVIAFLPGSQVDIRPIRDITPLMGITQPFQILKIDRKQGNIVVSRRSILEESRTEARKELLSNIVEGQILEGVVKNITNYGAFLDLGSIDGLLHVTDISWGRINHPSEVLTVGQTVQVQVIKYNAETKRISLGMKQLESDPWAGIEKRYPRGSKFSGKVTNITDYGAFIELEPRIEGLVHVSEISWSKNNLHPKKLLSLGQEVDFMVLDIDAAKHRISLGIKQCTENPWAKFAQNNPVGSVIEGEIKNIVDFGLFVGFEDDIDGLVHVSDLSWAEDNTDELKKFNKDDKVKVMVLAVDVEKERIGLGIKQLESDPFDATTKDLKKNSAITCTIVAVKEDGIEVSPCEGVTSFIKKADLSSDRAEQKTDRFAVGDRIDAKVVSIDKNTRKVNLSIRALEVDEQKKAIAEFGSTDSGASLGDILGAAISKAEENKSS